jgi:hypothetical protein
MIRYLILVEVLYLHRQVIQQSVGALGIRDLGLLQLAVAKPKINDFWRRRFYILESLTRLLHWVSLSSRTMPW